MQSILTSKGQITLPEPIRQRLHLQPGDAVEFIVGDQGEIKLMPVTSSITRLKGMLPPPKKALTIEAMQEAIVKGAVNSCSD
jgi:antitoxin PrlF